MTVSGIGSKAFLEKMAGSYHKKNAGQKDYGNVAGNLDKKSPNMEEEKETSKTRTGSVQVDYHSGKVSTLLAVTGTGRIHAEATLECEARHITYAESDQVKVYAKYGYSLKAQVILDEHQVYVEQKNEDGTVQGYMVNPFRVPEDSTNPIELLAKECWETSKDLLNDGTFTELTAELLPLDERKTFGEALQKFREFVEDRIENGPPKILIGGAEFSEEEWDKLLKEIDDVIDAIKEELRQRIAQEKAEQNLSNDTERTELINAAETLEEEIKSEPLSAPRRGSSFLARIQGEKRAPYSYLADENGMINYKGVIFRCDNEKKQICLGNTSKENEKNVLTIPLSGGGCLRVDRDSLGDLAKAIGMFSPEDVNRILRAIAQDNKAREMEMEIEEETSELGSESE